MATDMEDLERVAGGAAVRDVLKAARPPWPEEPPLSVYEEAQERVALSAKPFTWRPENELPPREWLYGRHLLRKFLSVDVAAGGVGKSSLKVVEALAMCSGIPLLRKDVHGGPLRVWLYNLEDPDEETERRIHAAAKHYELTPSHIGDRLYVNSGREQPVCIAEETPSGARICRPVIEALSAAITDRGIDVLILDPFVSAHAIAENDNRAIDMVAKELARLADSCGCSINVVHHVRKQNGAEATADSARGASALIGAARSVVVYNRMTKEEGEQAGVAPEQVGFHFRTSTDKANLAPPEAAEWHRMNNVDLANGDQVGVACPWDWPDPFAGVSTAKLMAVQRALAEGQWRKDVRSRERWAGTAIAAILGLDADDDRDRKRLGQIIREWVKNGVLSEVEELDEHRKTRIHITVGRWVTE